LDEALRKAEELMMRALLPILVLDETADSVWNGKPLYGDRITIGIFGKNDTPQFRTALEYACKGYRKTKTGYLVYHRLEKNQQIKIPIRIKVIRKKYPFLDSHSLDSKLFGYEYYYLPNPYEDYVNFQGKIE